jgi:sugar phosphate isomerase/epimerase
MNEERAILFKYGISCALEPQPERQPVILRGTIHEVTKLAAEIGYDGVELFIRNPAQYDRVEMLEAAQSAGVAYCAIATGMEYNLNGLSLISDDASIRKAAVARLKEHLDLGAYLGCPVVVGIMRGNIPDFDRYREYEDRLSHALAELDAYAAECGGSIVVESILRYINNYLNSATETADYLRRLNLPRVKLHIDTHSMILEDRNLADSVRKTADILGYVHFPDSNRGYPGAGNIDFKPIMRALADAGYEGTIDLECQPYPTQRACAERGLMYLKALETVIRTESQDYRRL